MPEIWKFIVGKRHNFVKKASLQFLKKTVENWHI